MKNPIHHFRNKGFALVVTLSLMVLLTIIALGMLSLSSISLRSSGQSDAMTQAKNNARLALMIAIGELQKNIGPDQAITATSEIISPTPGKPNMTGVWRSWDYNPNSTNLNYAAEKTSRFRQWLVSTPTPADAATPNFASTAWTGNTINLVDTNSLGGSTSASEKATAGLVPIYNGAGISGAYAWHVADESVKARINSYRDPSQNTTLSQKRALLTGHRPDTSVIELSGNKKLDFLPKDFSTNDFDDAISHKDKIVNLNQVNLLPTDPATNPATNTRIQPFRNHVTPYSLGVLCDVRKGGLKQDLTSLLELGRNSLPPAFAGRRLYESTHGITGPSDPFWSRLSDYYNLYKSIDNRDINPVINKAPTQNVNFSNNTPPTDFFPGPVIVKAEVVFSYFTGQPDGWTEDLRVASGKPDLAYKVFLIYTPIITLHNPYNINIQFDSIEVNMESIPAAILFKVNGTDQNIKPVPFSEMYHGDHRSGQKQFVTKIANWTDTNASSTLVSEPINMSPGQTLVCTPFLNPGATTNNDYTNNLTGTLALAVKGKPGYRGPLAGYLADWVNPDHAPYDNVLTPPGWHTQNGILAVRATDIIGAEFSIQQPNGNALTNTEFRVTAKLTKNNQTFDYGGLSFKYSNGTVLNRYYNEKVSNTPMAPNSTYMNDVFTTRSQYANANPIGVFSAQARTTNGGVYESNERQAVNGRRNQLKDGRLAGKPYLFHNPAINVSSIDLSNQKLSDYPYEINVQPFMNLGELENYFEIDPFNRTRSVTGNLPTTGIKSAAYLELPQGPIQTIADFRRSNVLASSYMPYYTQPIGNSLISPIMFTNGVRYDEAQTAPYTLLDHSTLANHALYDRFYFSTFANNGSLNSAESFENFINRSAPLLTQSFEPYLPAGRSVTAAQSSLFNGINPSDTAYLYASQYQMVRGSFNVNSTSVQAWKAVLSSLRNSNIPQLAISTANNQLLSSLTSSNKNEAVMPGMSLTLLDIRVRLRQESLILWGIGGGVYRGLCA